MIIIFIQNICFVHKYTNCFNGAMLFFFFNYVQDKLSVLTMHRALLTFALLFAVLDTKCTGEKL